VITSAGYAAFSQLFKNTTFDNTSAVLDQDLMKTVCTAPYLERATSD
jgi:hypothetical protein